MCVSKYLRLGMIASVLGLSLLEAGCTHERDAGTPGPQGNDRGGAVTTASPGGANVRPNEGTPSGVR